VSGLLSGFAIGDAASTQGRRVRQTRDRGPQVILEGRLNCTIGNLLAIRCSHIASFSEWLAVNWRIIYDTQF